MTGISEELGVPHGAGGLLVGSTRDSTSGGSGYFPPSGATVSSAEIAGLGLVFGCRQFLSVLVRITIARIKRTPYPIFSKDFIG